MPTTPSKLSTLVEREQTPEAEQPNIAVATSAPSKTSGIPQPTQWSTPSSRNLLKPAFEEMHPSRAQTTSKKIGFAQRVYMATGTAPTATPSKTNDQIEHTSPSAANPFSSPTFDFKFKRPSIELSSDAQKLMNELRDNAARYKTELALLKEQDPDEYNQDGRKIASAKGKMGRYSDVHLKEFKKMNSIANHPSAFRADPSKIATPTTPNKNLKRTNSKAGLDKPELPIKRTLSSKSLVSEPSSELFTSPAKRFKTQSAEATASAAKPTPGHATPVTSTSTSERAQTGIPAPKSHLTTPTKASLARSASTKSIVVGPSKIPMLPKSPSVPAFRTPQPERVTPAVVEQPRNIRTSFANKLKNVKSILRRPQIRFSDDPVKIAAGTHVATPKTNTSKVMTSIPEDVPGTPSHRAEKHVEFSPEPDTVFQLSARASSPAQPPTPSPASPSNVVSPSAQLYPALPPMSPNYPSTSPGDFTFRSDNTISFSPKPTTPTIRRVRVSDTAAFAPVSPNRNIATTLSKLSAAPTRHSDLPSIPHGISNKKRKRESEDVGIKEEDKENEEMMDIDEKDEVDESPKKRARMMTTDEKAADVKKPLAKPAGKLTRPSAAARSGSGQKKSFLSLSRLNALARPKGRG